MKVLFSTIFLGMMMAFTVKNYGPKYTVTIDAPIDEVWSYASNSSNATEWSVFFDHISTLPGIEDGKVGSVRRCFRFQDETGPTWDEEVISTTKYKSRQIKTYNLQNFKEKSLKDVEFDVFQTYESVGPTQTKLTFSSNLKNYRDLIHIIPLLSMSSETKRIFEYNLKNIKEAIESRYEGREYKRPYPFERVNSVSDQ